MRQEKIIITKSIQSQQSDKTGKPIVDLIIGDIVEKREDGIFFTRKINTISHHPDVNLSSIFDGIKAQNELR